nr:RNA dependent RNA polymerase [Turkana Partiti-like virus 2]
MLRYIGKTTGFASRTFARISKTPYLNDLPEPTELWRSPVTQHLIEKDLREFDNSCKRPDSYELDLAIMDAERAFRLENRVKMIHLNDVFQQDLEIWTRSPGLPWKNHGYDTKDAIRKDPDAVQSVRRFWHFVKLGKPISFPDCCAYVRSHITERDSYKVRAVWGYPATITFGEAVFAVPLIRGFQREQKTIAYGFETFLGGCKKIRDYLGGAPWYAALDFKKFDKTVPAWLIHCAFAILARNIDFGNYEDYGTADCLRMYHMYKTLEDYFINTTIRTARGHRFRKNSGIASGSYFTQLVGSICNYIIINYLFRKQRINIINLKVLGDDSIVSSTEKFDLMQGQIDVMRLGLRLNIGKSDISNQLDDLVFLGYKINHGFPLKSHNDWLASLLYPERPDESFDDVASRALGIYYANMGVDPIIHKLCYGLIKLKPFDLKLSTNFERMLRHIGVTTMNPQNPPDSVEFMVRMGVL